MISCRYVGSGCSSIGEREFDCVGQRASLSEVGFREAVLGNAPFISEEDFVKCGFHAGELAEYGPSGSRINPTPTFWMSLAMAQEIFREVQARMLVDETHVLSEVREPEPVVGLY